MSGNSFQDTEYQSVTIYSIGHSNQPMEAFLELLNRHSIQALIDVRSHPYSRYVPHFNGPELAHAAGRVNIQYLFMGKELGGRPDGEEDPTACHRHLLIGRVLAQQGINLLHIRGDGHIQTAEELASLEEVPLYEQLSLLDEQAPDRKDRKGSEWRSIRPVSRRRQQPNSSDH